MVAAAQKQQNWAHMNVQGPTNKATGEMDTGRANDNRKWRKEHSHTPLSPPPPPIQILKTSTDKYSQANEKLKSCTRELTNINEKKIELDTIQKE